MAEPSYKTHHVQVLRHWEGCPMGFGNQLLMGLKSGQLYLGISLQPMGFTEWAQTWRTTDQFNTGLTPNLPRILILVDLTLRAIESGFLLRLLCTLSINQQRALSTDLINPKLT